MRREEGVEETYGSKGRRNGVLRMGGRKSRIKEKRPRMMEEEEVQRVHKKDVGRGARTLTIQRPWPAAPGQGLSAGGRSCVYFENHTRLRRAAQDTGSHYINPDLPVSTSSFSIKSTNVKNLRDEMFGSCHYKGFLVASSPRDLLLSVAIRSSHVSYIKKRRR